MGQTGFFIDATSYSFIHYNYSAVPGKPTGPLRCTNLTHNSVTLTWNPPDDDGGTPLTGYEVECLFLAYKALNYVKSVNKDTTSCTCRNLHEGDKYTFRIHALNREGRSEKLETDEAVEPKRIKGNISAFL